MVTSIGAVLGSAVGLLLHTDILVFSLAVLFPQGDMASFGFNVMQMMEVFSIWGAVLTAIGLSVLCQWSKTKSYIVSFLLFILGVLFSAASTTSVFWMYDMMSKNGLF